MLPDRDRGKHGMKKSGKGSGKVMPSGSGSKTSSVPDVEITSDSSIPLIRVQDNVRVLPKYATCKQVHFLKVELVFTVVGIYVLFEFCTVTTLLYSNTLRVWIFLW